MDKQFGVEPGITRLLLEVAALAVKTGKFEDGERILRAVRSSCENLPQASIALVLLLMRQGRWDEALREQQAALAHFPGSPLSSTLLALIQRELGNDEWHEHMQQALCMGREEWLAALSQGSLAQALVQTSSPAGERQQQLLAQVRRILC